MNETISTLIYVLKIFGMIIGAEAGLLLIIFMLFPERFLKIEFCEDCAECLMEHCCCGRNPANMEGKYLYQNYCGIFGCVCGCGTIPGCVQCLCDSNVCNKTNWFMDILTAISSNICCCIKRHKYMRQRVTIEATKCDVCCYNCMCCTNDKYYCCCTNNYGVPVEEYGCCDALIARHDSYTNNKCVDCCLCCCCSSGDSRYYHRDHRSGNNSSYEDNSNHSALCCVGCYGCDGCNCTNCYCSDCSGGGDGLVVILAVALFIIAVIVGFSIFILAYVILRVITADSPQQVKLENRCLCGDSDIEFEEAPGWIRVDSNSDDGDPRRGEGVNDIESQHQQEQPQQQSPQYYYPQQPQDLNDPSQPQQNYVPPPQQTNPYDPSQPQHDPPLQPQQSDAILSQPSPQQYLGPTIQTQESPYDQEQYQENPYNATQHEQTHNEQSEPQSYHDELNHPEQFHTGPQLNPYDENIHDKEQSDASEQNNEDNINEKHDPYDL